MQQGGRAAAAHLQRALERGELLGRAVVLGAAPRALRHGDVVEEDAHLAARPRLSKCGHLGLLLEELQHLCDLAQLQPVLVRVVGVEPVRRGGRALVACRCDRVEQAELLQGVECGERPPRVGDDEDAERVHGFPLLHLFERHPRAGRQVLAPRQYAALVGEPRQPRRVDQHGVGQGRLERRGVGLVRAHLVPLGGLGQLRRDQLGLLLLLGPLPIANANSVSER